MEKIGDSYNKTSLLKALGYKPLKLENGNYNILRRDRKFNEGYAMVKTNLAAKDFFDWLTIDMGHELSKQEKEFNAPFYQNTYNKHQCALGRDVDYYSLEGFK